MSDAPSIGRIVHYQPTADGAAPRAAIVTAVDHEEKSVALTILHPATLTQKLRVFRSKTGEPESGRWNWPPRV